MMSMPLLVSIIDDDVSVRESLPDLLMQFGFATRAFCSAEEFLRSDALLSTRCLILDVAMPGMSGPDLHGELIRRRLGIPIIFITASTDEGMRTSLIEQGAVDCLFKPLNDGSLFDALNVALQGQ
jgi:FixJ family two-component response regulator